MNLQEKRKSLVASIKALDKPKLSAEETKQLEAHLSELAIVKTQIAAQKVSAEAASDEAAAQEAERKAEIDAAVKKALAEAADPINSDLDNVQVTDDEADRAAKDNPFKTLAGQCRAIKGTALNYGVVTDVRLKALAVKASVGLGGTETVPSEGGFLLQPLVTGALEKPLHEEGPYSMDAKPMPVSGPSNSGWVPGVDETSRVDGSRWGGIRGYWLAEAGTKTASQPKFRRINWELKKLAVVVYGTDELLADASLFESVVREGSGEEINFKVNDAMVNGLGAVGPLGILNSTAKVEISAETNQVASTIVFENLNKMWARMPTRSKPRAKWYINTDCNPELDNIALAVGTGGIPPRFIDYNDEGAMRIKGRPVVETEFNATLGTAGDIILADMSQYLFFEKGPTEVASSIHVQFLTDQEVFRFVKRVDGTLNVASALTPFKGSNTLSPVLTLASRT